MSDAPTGLTDFHVLLELQVVDTEIDQLLHRRAHLPALAEIEAIKVRAGALRPQMAEATATRDGLQGRQNAFEAEITAATERVAQINERLYGPTPVPGKDAEAMLAEQKHLQERKSGLEDSEFEIMEALEPAQAALDVLEQHAHSMAKDLRQAQAQLLEDEATIDDELRAKRVVRAQRAEPIPKLLLAEYERLRSSLGGVAAAPLNGSSCGGCHLSMAGAELNQIRSAAPNAIVHCEECGRILVRAS